MTREIAVYRDPARHDDFLWRLSIATVARSGPFSRFDGVDRTVALIEGVGMALHARGKSTIVRIDTPPYSFDGEAEVVSELDSGPTVDLNVMTRRAFFRHTLRRVQVSGQLEIEGMADETIVVSNGCLELPLQELAGLQPLDTVAEIARGSVCELYSKQATEIFIVELTSL